jgi:hypothetical protein
VLEFSFVLVGNDRPWARKMVESVRKHHPRAVTVQMSDEHTEQIADVLVRRPYDGHMMTFRLDHLAAYAHSEMVILDDDCMVKGCLSHVFGAPFDVALTRRTDPAWYEESNITESCPYNTGVMFSRSTAFWKRAAAVCHHLPPRFQKWWGDQMAVAVTAQKGGFRVVDLDAKVYNWTPDSDDDTSSAVVWHYKGKRKQWI